MKDIFKRKKEENAEATKEAKPNIFAELGKKFKKNVKKNAEATKKNAEEVVDKKAKDAEVIATTVEIKAEKKTDEQFNALNDFLNKLKK